MARQLVDFQLYRKNKPVGDRVSTSLDPDDQGDIRGFFSDAIKRDWDRAPQNPRDYSIRVWERGTGNELFTYPS